MNAIFTVNGGSSSLKCGLFRITEGTTELLYSFKLSNILGEAKAAISDAQGQNVLKASPDFSAIGREGRHQACLDFVFAWIRDQLPECELQAVSHRVVHGGEQFREPVRLDGPTLDALHAFVPLAPLHQPYNLKLVEACQALLPEVPQIACFDTMFHTGQPDEARNFALPRQLTAEGIRRYGFHGLSYEFIQRRLEQVAPEQARSRTIVAHLGAGASMCAIRDGRSLTSTMGFTAVEGLPMGSRTGSIDPGVLLYLMRHHGMDADRLETLLYKESGWLGVSGISSDMQELLASERPEAREAVDLFTYRAAREIGSLSAATQGLEQLVFTGGVGENSAPIRTAICERSRWLGIEIDPAANAASADVISTGASRVTVRVIPTDEESMLALHGMEMVAG
ncbi:acetate/propionate family kinase [Motiliproteus sp. SC1-56]|uniref:acetate/propionate family kinase n=1 Tax=Motiliproteus sp. SC1-56 TaxID=2799565 RepID=UPI001A8E0A52|nr:acetate/propionate family kinase [Motiliproteus sp. SC1-56]